MKKTRSVFLGILSLSVILILATGCYRPAAPDVTPTSAEGAEAATPEEPDLQASAIVNTTRAAQTMAAQTAEAEPAGEGEEPTETSMAPPATATSEPPTPAASPTSPAPTAEPTATPAPSGETTYVVQPGDNLFRIALRYGTTVQAIAQANGIANASQISVGQELTIPAGGQPSQPAPSGTTYVVKPGDNLFRIALRYNMSYQRLAEYNGIANPANIYVGQVLRIPPE